jgi:FtsP/CotA-like multicopper oxidase with cupredoxin domain
VLATSTHLYGAASLPQFDGYASDVTHPGFFKDYHYPSFQPARTLWYHDHGVHFTAQNAYSGLWGDVILVNGKPWPVMKVQKRIYRFRVLNCSISRSVRLTLSTGDPLIIVGTDGGLVPTPQKVANYRHAGAERYEVLIDFRKYKTGQRIELRNLSNPNNVDYDFTNKVMAFDVTEDAVNTSDPTGTRYRRNWHPRTRSWR